MGCGCATPAKAQGCQKRPNRASIERIKEERLHKEEELQRMLEREEEERENQVTVEAQSAIEEKKGKESPYRVKPGKKEKGVKRRRRMAGGRQAKKNKWVIKFTPPGEKHGTGSTDASVDRLHFAQPSTNPM